MTMTSSRPRLPRTVWVLGIVSLLMDLSSEIYHALLPAFLTITLGLPVAAMGALDGISEATANMAKLVSGKLSDHQQRRSPIESMLMSAALDEIKKRHGISSLSVAGQSGGGHVVASLLTMRSDIDCAVAASSPSSPRMRWMAAGRTKDFTGLDSFEPTEHLSAATGKPGLRVFVLGDP